MDCGGSVLETVTIIQMGTEEGVDKGWDSRNRKEGIDLKTTKEEKVSTPKALMLLHTVLSETAHNTTGHNTTHTS